jgi:hypothetical protein
MGFGGLFDYSSGMFTGLVETLGRVVAATPEPPGMRLAIEAEGIAADARIGDSICTSGCCLSIVRLDGSMLEFELGPETLARTTLGRRRAGEPGKACRCCGRRGQHGDCVRAPVPCPGTASACRLSRVRRLTPCNPILRDPIPVLDWRASTDASEPEETGLPTAAGYGRVPVLTRGRFVENQSRWNSLRVGSNTGAHIGQSQQLMDNFDRHCGAALAKCLSALARQSN